METDTRFRGVLERCFDTLSRIGDTLKYPAHSRERAEVLAGVRDPTAELVWAARKRADWDALAPLINEAVSALHECTRYAVNAPAETNLVDRGGITVRQMSAATCERWNKAVDVLGRLHVFVLADGIDEIEEITAAGERRARELSEPGAATDTSERRPRKRGRPTDTDPKADAKVAEAWESGHHETHVKLANAMGLSEKVVKAALERHRKRQARKNVK